MFWGLVLEPSKKYTQKVYQTFHISQAALDFKSCDQEPIQIVVEYENSNFILATLCKKANIFQVPLDLVFKAGDQVSFRTIGNGKVHLSGYHVLEDLDSMLMKGEEESDYEEMEVEDTKKKRKKANSNGKTGKKPKLDESNEDESDHVEQTGTTNSSKKKKKKLEANSSFTSLEFSDDDEDGMEGEDDEEEDDEDLDLEDDDDDDDMDDLDEEEDDDLEFDDESDEDEEDDDEDDSELEEEVKVKSPKMENKKMSNGTTPKGKEKEKLNKSKSENKKETPNKEMKTPKSEKKGDKLNKTSDGEKGSARKGSDDLKAGEKTPKSSKSEGAEKKVLEGGVICEEIKVGNGPVAKPGKMVNVYYVGSLHSTKKQFDSVQSGPGFKFKLGKNEVIKGWDIGLNGMKVGGTRRLTIPAYLAYGAKGSPPVIPPNSTLVFTVELRGLS